MGVDSKLHVGTLTVENNIVPPNQGTKVGGLATSTKGDGTHNVTTITIPSGISQSVASATSAAYYKKILTFPTGAIRVSNVYMSVNPNLYNATGGVQATSGSADVGLGITLASGANVALSVEGATTENILTGQAVTISGGAATVQSAGSLQLPAASAHTVYLNMASLWTASGTLRYPGTIVIDWVKLT